MLSPSLIQRLAAASIPAISLICGLFLLADNPSYAQRGRPPVCDRPGGCDVIGVPPRDGGGGRTVIRNIPQPPVFRPTPTPTPTPTTVLFVPPPVETVTPLVPVDVTSINYSNPEVVDPLLLSDVALNGISKASTFRTPDDSAPANGVVVKAVPGTEWSQSNCIVTVTRGQALVSVTAPTERAVIKTAYGDVAVDKGASVMVSLASPLRVFNLDGRGDRVKVKVTSIPGLENKLVSVAPGYELVVGPEKLGRSDLRPGDGLARRYSKVLENGHMAVSEFSVESFMSTSQLIAQMAQKDAGSKEKRILGDMSKMAAVLNQLNGVQGFVASGEHH